MTCSASSEHSAKHACSKAIDGAVTEGDWATKGQGTGAWILLNFGKMYQITRMKLHHRYYTGFKDLLLRFSNGEDFLLQMGKDPYEWNEIVLPANFSLSTHVNITVTSHYAGSNDGFAEIVVYACDSKGIDKHIP